ncbi:MAG: hypothetical protein ACK4RT_09280 [Erythrobacter sp.]
MNDRLRLADPVAAPDPQWRAAFADLIAWLGVTVDPVAAGRPAALCKLADWRRGAAGADRAVRFMPWQAISPVALQQASAAPLPHAQWIASYLFDHSVGGGRVHRKPLDLMLISPRPAACAADEAGAPALPRPALIQAMIRAARAEGRSRIAIIVPAALRNGFARQLLAGGRAFARAGLELDIIAIEQALGALTLERPAWDALIVMPRLRGIVFALLAEASAIRAPWPMLWHGSRGVELVTSEALCEAGARLPLDAPVLVQSLAITLHHAGMTAAARHLHEACVRLRDKGVVTPSRGSCAPYANTHSDAQFISLICAGMGIGSRPVPRWRALGEGPAGRASAAPVRLNLVAANPSPQS